jgi:hypothetical protein
MDVDRALQFEHHAHLTHLKNRILVQDRGGAEFKTGGILLYVEDFKRGTNKDIGPKDIFELGSKFYNSLTSGQQFSPGAVVE